MAILCVFGASLLCEVFCFSIIALGVLLFCTDRITDYYGADATKIVSTAINFVQNGSDKRLRVLAIIMEWMKAAT